MTSSPNETSIRVVQSQARLALLLATTAGFIDAYGLINYQTFISLMGGNTTRTGSEAAVGNWLMAGHAALAIVCFVSGITLGTVLMYPQTRHCRRLVFLLSAGMIALNLASTQLPTGWSWAGIATLSLSMGMVNTTLCHIGPEKINLTFVTGMLSHIGTHVALQIKQEHPSDAQSPADSHLRRALLLASVWTAFVAGAALSGWATPMFGAYSLVPPLTILLLLAACIRAPD